MKPQRKNERKARGFGKLQLLESYFFVAVSCAGAGNKCPMKRLAFPDIDQDLLNDSLDSYVRAFGMKGKLQLVQLQGHGTSACRTCSLDVQAAQTAQSLVGRQSVRTDQVPTSEGRCSSYFSRLSGRKSCRPITRRRIRISWRVQLPIA